MRVSVVMLAFLLAGCGTKFGYSLGDMTYVHKPRCDSPAKEWISDDYAPIYAPSRKRIGGMMSQGGAQKVEGHWHYYCS